MTSSSSSGLFDFNHWLLRLVAYIIDGIILAIVTWIIWIPITLFAAVAGALDFYVWGWLGFSFIWGILQVLYFTVLDVYWGATIGKRILGFQVQLTNSGRVPFDKALIRNISKIFWPLLILDWLIGVAAPGVDRRQKYSDHIAGTTVVSARHALSSVSSSSSSSSIKS